MSANIYAALPEVIEIVSLDDAGEGGAASCPHCGAIGRYVYWFIASDGQTHGAMKGCFARFPKSRFMVRLSEILSKEKEAAKKGRKIASWDRDIMDAIRRYASGAMVDWQVDDVIRKADYAKRAYMASRGYR